MDWFSGLFLLAFVAALITKKAYFREVISRDESPGRYWRAVICYGVLASYSVIALPMGLLSSLLTDAATRVAEDIESGTDAMNKSGAVRYVITHRPKATPDGCNARYTLQLSKASSLLVWCKDVAGKVTSSHATTYHLRFVDVPETFIVDKKPAEPSFIDLEKHDGKIVVINLR